MSHIKINHTNSDGKRTSTTINRNIAFHFYLAAKPPQSAILPDDYEDDVRRTVQKFVNESKYQYSKNDIENKLLHAISTLSRKFVTDRLN